MSAIIFISVALEYKIFASIIFLYSCFSDILDGFLAKHYKCTTEAGKFLDLFGDKFLTIISIMFLSIKGMPIIPCTLIVLREVFLLSMRNVKNSGELLLPPQRILGGFTVFPIWLFTFFMILHPDYIKIDISLLNVITWLVAVLTTTNLLYKVISNWGKILNAFEI